jgi:hypothetical protein
LLPWAYRPRTPLPRYDSLIPGDFPMISEAAATLEAALVGGLFALLCVYGWGSFSVGSPVREIDARKRSSA